MDKKRVRSGEIPNFVRNDIVREIINNNNNFWTSENEAEGYVWLHVNFRGKLYTSPLAI